MTPPLLRPLRQLAGLALATGIAALAACASPPAGEAPVLIFGEQHDQPDIQRQVADSVTQLAAQGRLAAVVIEMAERGRGTTGLPATAPDEQVRAALAWDGWDWPAYQAVVMAAVRAGVPVLGGNLPRPQMREAMADAALDGQIDGTARAQLANAVRDGHCGLLPASQEPGMVRIQIARDRSMAQTVAQAAASAPAGARVVLLTGAQHASRDRGVPLHLRGLAPPVNAQVVMFSGDNGLAADQRRPSTFVARPDPCEAMRRQMEAAQPKG